MIKFKNYFSIPEDFTGVCKILDDGVIYYYKNGKLHREDGPAVEYPDDEKHWYINGRQHREDGPAIEFANGFKNWIYKNRSYGTNSNFTNESWIEFVENKKREEQLEIFK